MVGLRSRRCRRDPSSGSTSPPTSPSRRFGNFSLSARQGDCLVHARRASSRDRLRAMARPEADRRLRRPVLVHCDRAHASVRTITAPGRASSPHRPRQHHPGSPPPDLVIESTQLHHRCSLPFGGDLTTPADRVLEMARVTFARGVHVCGVPVQGWRSRRVHSNRWPSRTRCPAGQRVPSATGRLRCGSRTGSADHGNDKMLAMGRQNGTQAGDPHSASAPARSALAIVFSVVDRCDTVSGSARRGERLGDRLRGRSGRPETACGRSGAKES